MDLPPEPEHGIEADYEPEVLAALDAWQPPERPGDPPLPSRLVTWSRSSLLGAVITGSALGIRAPQGPEQVHVRAQAQNEGWDKDRSEDCCCVHSDTPNVVRIQLRSAAGLVRAQATVIPRGTCARDLDEPSPSAAMRS